jgi:hypothetical protein
MAEFEWAEWRDARGGLSRQYKALLKGLPGDVKHERLDDLNMHMEAWQQKVEEYERELEAADDPTDRMSAMFRLRDATASHVPSMRRAARELIGVFTGERRKTVVSIATYFNAIQGALADVPMRSLAEQYVGAEVETEIEQPVGGLGEGGAGVDVHEGGEFIVPPPPVQPRWSPGADVAHGGGFYADAVNRALGIGQRMERDVHHLTTYPVLTSGAAPAASGEAATRLGSLIDNALRGFVGQVPDATKPRSFLGALERNFEVTEVAGRAQVAWRRGTQGGATPSSADVAGRQGMLIGRFQASRAVIEQAAQKVRPFQDPTNPELIEGWRGMLMRDLDELLASAGNPRGPNRPRVQQLLMNRLPNDLNQFVAALGANRARTNTLGDAENRDVLDSIAYEIGILRASWATYLGAARGDFESLAARLRVLLEALDSAADEAEAAMDAAMVDQGDRAAAPIDPADPASMTIQDLLDWVRRFGSEDAPRLIEQSGRLGASTIAVDATTLATAANRLAGGGPGLPGGLSLPRVRQALRQLAASLTRVRQMADDVDRSG